MQSQLSELVQIPICVEHTYTCTQSAPGRDIPASKVKWSLPTVISTLRLDLAIFYENSHHCQLTMPAQNKNTSEVVTTATVHSTLS